ncbi:unnamed protein product [Agarophyton chilense]
MASSTTDITCGLLRLSVPISACMPTVQLVDERAVRLSFSNFSGTVLFQALPQHHHGAASPVVPALSETPLVPSISALPEPSQSFPCSQPVHSFEKHDMSPSVPLPHFPHQYLQLTPSSSPSPPSSPLRTHPCLVPLTQHSSPVGVSQDSQQPERVEQLSDSQLIDEKAVRAVTKPSSQRRDVAENAIKKSDLIHKRPLPLPKVEDRGAKQGKRVRFDEDPIIFSSPPKHSPKITVATPWSSQRIPDGNLPSRRWGATLSKLDADSYLLLGGESELSGFMDSMSLYRAKENRWILSGQDVPPMPDGGRAWHTTCVIDGNLLVFGGEKQVNGERVQSNDLLVYDTSYFSWYPPSYFGTKPSARAGHCASIIPGSRNIVVYGGINGKKWLNDLFVLEELFTWKKIKPSSKSARPSARSYASLTPASGYLVLFGGNNKTKCFNDLHLLSTETFVWTEVTVCGRVPKPRTGHCAIPSGNGKNVIVYGGWDDQGLQRIFFSDVWELRVKSATECMWVCLFHGDQKSRTPGPRAGASMCVGIENECDAIMYGGWHQLTYYNDLTKLSVAKKKSKFSTTEQL